MTQEVKEEVKKFLRAGDRDQAIRHLQDTFSISLQDANLLVETLENEMGFISPAPGSAPPFQPDTSATTLGGALKTEVAQMLSSGQKMQAIKHVRQSLRVGLKDALSMVEEIAKEQNPNYVAFNATGCLQMIAKGMGVFFLIVSFMFLAAAGIIYFLQSRSISNSDRVDGVVTAMRSNDTGASAPVVEYEWRGNKRSHQSNFYSSPPGYEVGQQIQLFVNRDDPEDITIDTFSDRWALIVGLSVPGAIVFAISIVFLYFGKRKF